jgi:molecular chaperone DnaK
MIHGSLSRVNPIIGIDLGTTNSLVAAVDSGIPVVLADADGRRLTPSVVHFAGTGGEPIVGHAARRALALHPAETVYSIKRFMGRRGADIAREELVMTYPMEGRGSGPVRIPIHGRAYTPEEVSAEILKKLRRDAEQHFGGPVSRAVITVPAYFNDAQRNATKTAGELAGLTVERILNEPTAAALAYGLDQLGRRARIAVYDLGGGTFDLSILELNDGVFQVLATHGDTRLGGDDIDRRIVSFLIGQIGDAIGSLRPWLDAPGAGPPSPRRTDDGAALSILARLREAAEAAKVRLSTETETEIALPFLTPEYSLRCTLTRVELEELARDLVDRTRGHCLQALADARLEPRQLDQVILVGGQTRMPLVRRRVAEWFQCAEFEEARGNVPFGAEARAAGGPQLNTSQNPEEAVVLGAAIQAEILAGGIRNVLLLDVTPLSLGLETFGGLMNVIIARNSTIPVKAGEMFTSAVDGQREMLIHVLQGERERARDNWSLGRFTIGFDPAPRGVARVGVQFEIDANGILHVLARDVKTGRQTEVVMKSAVDVDDAAVQAMVEGSVAHAFEDLAARRWIETRLKARELISATRKALADSGGELEADDRTGVETALAGVEGALATEDSATGIGDVAKLQSACAALDAATRPLAELLMDKVAAEWLRKRGVAS